MAYTNVCIGIILDMGSEESCGNFINAFFPFGFSLNSTPCKLWVDWSTREKSHLLVQ